ncbi:MAG: hypothetical protein ACFFER_11785 [Candidatus Thorarchaeota archaeon]
MSVEVIVSDLGPFKGKHKSTLDRNAINIVEAPNAFGKSSFIKCLAASLGLPAKSRLSHDVACRLGLLSQNPTGRNPLVNLDSDRGSLSITAEDMTRTLEVPAHGAPKTKPKGDDRFLITGLLLREGEIVRRLDEGTDDFSWLVSTLSLSSNYEDAKRVVEEYQIDTRDTIELLKERRKSIENLLPEIKKLGLKRKSLRDKRNAVESKLAEVLDPDPDAMKEIEEQTRRRDGAEKVIEELRMKLLDAEREKGSAESEFRSLKNRVSEAEKTIKRVQSKLEKLPTRKEVQESEKEARGVRKNIIPDIREEYGRLRAEIDLLSQAEQWMTESTSVPCPLCERVHADPIGSIPVDNFSRALSDVRDKYRDTQTELAREIQRAEDLELIGIDAERKREKLEKEKKSHASDVGMWKTSFIRSEREFKSKSKLVSSIQEDIEAKEKSLQDAKKSLKQLQKQFGGDKREKLVSDIRKVESELARVDTKISGLERETSNQRSFEIAGRSLELEKALLIQESWYNLLSALIDYTDSAIMQQRRGAAQAFNNHIMRLVEEMDFGGLRVWIDESSYELKVQRETESGSSDQPISSLSTSERHALAAVLTLAAKEAYAPDIPFFLVDELLLDFDDRRLSAFLGYLKDAALRKDQIVIVSRLGGSRFKVFAKEGK